MAIEKQKTIQKTHNIIMENRERLSVSGVLDVASFDEREIIMTTVCGSLIIRGSELKIDKLSLETSDVTLGGIITELCYEEVASSQSLWAKLFH